MENRKTKKPNDPLLCRKKESKRGFEVPKEPIMCLRKKKTTSKYRKAVIKSRGSYLLQALSNEALI